MNPMVLDVSPVQSGLITQVLVILLIAVVNDRLPTIVRGEREERQRKKMRSICTGGGVGGGVGAGGREGGGGRAGGGGGRRDIENII